MSKIELNETNSGYNLQKINNNFKKIATEFNEKVLYRDNPDGEPNEMLNDLDMNGNRIYNLPTPTQDHEAARLKDVQDAVIGNVNANLIQFEPTEDISSTTVQGAIEEVFNARDVVAVDSIDDLLALPERQRREGLRYLVRGSEFYWEDNQFVLLGPLNVESFKPQEDATSAIQQALSFGAKVVMATDRQYVCDSVEVPPYVEFHANLKLRTPFSNLVLVNTGSRVFGTLEGTDSGNDTERLVYPARNGVDAVHLDVTVSRSSVGVQASPVTPDSFLDEDIPKGWTGTIRAVDISGDGAERGYGFLGSPCNGCNITVMAKNIPRHALYFSNGASGNNATVHVDGVGHGAVQLAAFDGQRTVRNNKVSIFCKNVYVAVNDNAFGVNLAGNVRDNDIDLFMSNSPNATGLALLRSLSNSAVCRNNSIRIHQEGPVAGPVLVLNDGGVENEVSISGSGGSTAAGTKTLVTAANYGAAPAPEGVFRHALRLSHVSYDAGGDTLRMINANANYAGVHIGNGVVNFQNTAEASPIRDNTFGAGFLEGFVFDEDFRYDTESIPAGGVVNVTVPLPRVFTCPPEKRRLSFHILAPGFTAISAPSAVLLSLGTNAAVFSVSNNSGDAVSASIVGRQTGW